ncbi:phage tail protein [Pasteurellaceae bacterium USgator11]|nr:phage tail protein [Pasteurellaceae bacterium UScroc12]TNG94883.1 phage tail protein [Pasteurellaceae bacterium USgator41]TNH00433.1 phage tail protein [Pasteurellaceae bacterium UScroc31]TNH01736.1 phage tail protein [Pasteurellaceae bacterium USgator11]
METFNYTPDWKMKRKKKPSVAVVSFGDGYEQRSKNGINNNLRAYDVVFTRNEATIKAIDGFLSARGAVEAFLWTPYGDTQGRFKCEEWETDHQTGFGTLTATFKEVVA